MIIFVQNSRLGYELYVLLLESNGDTGIIYFSDMGIIYYSDTEPCSGCSASADKSRAPPPTFDGRRRHRQFVGTSPMPCCCFKLLFPIFHVLHDFSKKIALVRN